MCRNQFQIYFGMKKQSIIIVTIFFLLITNLFGQKKANMEGIEIGSIAPEIELPTVDGEDFKLSQLKGKLVFVNFWASWCAPCRKKAPYLINVFQKYNDVDFKDGEKGF